MSNVTDVTCTSLHGSLTCLTREATAGLTMAAGASLLSLGSVLFAFLVIVKANHGFRIFYNPMDILVFGLLFADFLQSLGGVLSLKWIRDGIVQSGMFCDAQGTLKTFGETGVAFTTLLIAIYTYATASTGKYLASMRITAALVVSIWAFVGILIGVGYAVNHDPSKPRYMSPVPYWCWIGDYLAWKLVGEYLWMWVSLFASCLLYIPLYLWMRGNLDFHKPRSSDPDDRRKALVLLVYPIVYCTCILPLSVVRWISFKQEADYGVSTVPPGYTFTVITIFGLSGFLNVILIFTTKPELGLFGRESVSLPSTVNHEEP